MKWSQAAPKEAGYYLRVNAGHRVQLEQAHYFDLDGFCGIKIFWSHRGSEKWLPVDNANIQHGPAGSGGWWWYGPIPKPPKEAEM